MKFHSVLGAAALGMTVFFAPAATAATILQENFDSLSGALGNGWVVSNESSPAGTTDWFQGNSGVMSAHQGAADSYVAANFNAADFGGTISDWLMTPTLSLENGDVFSFFTKAEDSVFPDRLELRLSTSGSSTDTGDFTSLYLTINPALAVGGYPTDWTQFTVTLSGLGSPAQGRLGFRYYVDDTSVNADYIGIDTVLMTGRTQAASSVPEPSTLLLFGSGLAFAGRRRRARKPIG